MYSNVCCCSVAKLCPTLATLWTAACRVSLSFPSSQSLHKLIAIELVMPSNHLILCHPLLLASVFPSIRVFSSESALCTRWPKYWSFSNNPSNEYSGLISFRIDWFDLLAVQGILESLLQRHNLKASVLRRSVFFMVQLSYLYMTTGKTIALTRWTFVNKVMSLLFNTLSRFAIPGWGSSLEKEMATHYNILAWEIPWTEEPGGLQSMGSQKVGLFFQGASIF